MRTKYLLAATALVGALGTAGMLTAPSANACVWTLGSTVAAGDLGQSFTQAGAASPGTTCGSSLTLTPNGISNGTGPSPPDLFNKRDGGATERTEGAGHGRYFQSRRAGIARQQIRTDRNAFRKRGARGHPESAERRPERRARTARQQIRPGGEAPSFSPLALGVSWTARGLPPTSRPLR